MLKTKKIVVCVGAFLMFISALLLFITQKPGAKISANAMNATYESQSTCFPPQPPGYSEGYSVEMSETNPYRPATQEEFFNIIGPIGGYPNLNLTPAAPAAQMLLNLLFTNKNWVLTELGRVYSDTVFATVPVYLGSGQSPIITMVTGSLSGTVVKEVFGFSAGVDIAGYGFSLAINTGMTIDVSYNLCYTAVSFDLDGFAPYYDYRIAIKTDYIFYNVTSTTVSDEDPIIYAEITNTYIRLESQLH